MPGGLLLRVGGSEWVLALAAVVFAVGAGVSWRVPRVQVADAPETSAAGAEPRGAGVLLAASAMALLRGIVGFLPLLLALALRTDGSPTWPFAVGIEPPGTGSFLGAAVGPTRRPPTT